MQKYANLVELEKCCQTHIFLKTFGFDTAENEPAKNLQKVLEGAVPGRHCAECASRWTDTLVPGFVEEWSVRRLEAGVVVVVVTSSTTSSRSRAQLTKSSLRTRMNNIE